MPASWKTLTTLTAAILLLTAAGCGARTAEDCGCDEGESDRECLARLGRDSSSPPDDACVALLGGDPGESDDNTTVKGTCADEDPPTYCTEYRGSSFSGAAVNQSCAENNSSVTFGTAGCPDEGRLGDCLFNAGTISDYRTYYYAAGGIGVEDARQLCEAAAGTFIP